MLLYRTLYIPVREKGDEKVARVVRRGRIPVWFRVVGKVVATCEVVHAVLLMKVKLKAVQEPDGHQLSAVVRMTRAA
jgi:hypothetical protein